jgi:hypothetical protein
MVMVIRMVRLYIHHYRANFFVFLNLVNSGRMPSTFAFGNENVIKCKQACDPRTPGRRGSGSSRLDL